MVDLFGRAEVGSPMKVFLQARGAHEFKVGSSDSPRYTAFGEGSSNGIDGGAECAMPYESMVSLPIDNSVYPLVSPEGFSEWQWNQSAMCPQDCNYSGACQHADLQIADFNPFLEPQFWGTPTGAFLPCQPPQSMSSREIDYQQQRHGAWNSVADSCPEMLFSSPLPGGVRSDRSGEDVDFQGGTCSEFVNVGPTIAEVDSEVPVSLPLGSIASNLSGDAFEFQGGVYSELPSVGSASHFAGWCKPCAFAYEGCVNGKACVFCHVCPPGELKARKRAKLSQRRKMNRNAQHNSQWTGR